MSRNKKTSTLLVFLIIKKNKAEDVTGGKAIVHEIIMSPGHWEAEPSAFIALNC